MYFLNCLLIRGFADIITNKQDYIPSLFSSIYHWKLKLSKFLTFIGLSLWAQKLKSTRLLLMNYGI